LGGIALALVLGLCLALVLRMNTLAIRVLLVSPLLLPSAAVAIIWRAVFAREGWLNQLLALFGLGGADWLKSSAGLLVLTLLLVWKVTGLNTVLLDAARRRIPREVIESARLDGAGTGALLFHIEWPYLAAHLFFAAMVDLYFAWRTFREIYLLAGDYPFDGIYLIQHYLMHMFRGLQYARLSHAALGLTAAIVLFAGALFLLSNIWGKDVEQ
jgi:multiple sugar transport system permease protein